MTSAGLAGAVPPMVVVGAVVLVSAVAAERHLRRYADRPAEPSGPAPARTVPLARQSL